MAARCAAALVLGLAAAAWAGAPAGRYTVGADTVVDTVTTLTWQRNVQAATYYNWADAATYCGALSLSGTGWRLPTMKELQSLVDFDTYSPAIDGVAFPATPSSSFWSSTMFNPTYAWAIDFNDGSTSHVTDVAYGCNVRCVR
jgi:hypothetical protein